MKRLILILLTCAMLVGCITCFAACGQAKYIELSSNGKGSELVNGLTSYLESLSAAIYPAEWHLEAHLDRVKQRNMRILHVSIDPDKYYYVCAYYNNDHDESSYCCVSEYTWVRFANKKDIREKFRGKSFVIAFQINSACFIRDIASNNDSTPIIEHYTVYTPEFVRGKNIADSLYCYEAYLYPIGKDINYVLDSVNRTYRNSVALSCIEIENEWYFMYLDSATYSGRDTDHTDFQLEFGKYYEDLFNVIEDKKYSETNGKWTKEYVLIDLNEFANVVFN